MSDEPKLKCGECGKGFDRECLAEFGDVLVCQFCKPKYAQKIKEGVCPNTGPRFDGEYFWLAVCLLPSAIVTIGIVMLKPRFVEMFEGMLAGEPLPALTRWVCAIPASGYIAFEAALITGSLIAHMANKSPKRRLVLRILLFLVGIAVGFLFMLSMFTPLIVTIERIG